MKKFFIKTFGCAQNQAEEAKIRNTYEVLGFSEVNSWQEADLIVINGCIVRESAENRIYGLIDKIKKYNQKNKQLKNIIVCGCLGGLVKRNPKVGKKLTRHYQDILFFDNNEFTVSNTAIIDDMAYIPISNGCNNFCSYCIVPFARGRETSYDFDLIIKSVKQVVSKGIKKILLIGQNVNSYGSDLITSGKVTDIKPIIIKSMGKQRVPTLFPQLLEKIASIPKITEISFVSSNPWDFCDELIDVIAKHRNISRTIHLPIQSGNDKILKKMNRGYTTKKYLDLVDKIRRKIPNIIITTDIIIGFPGETEKIFDESLEVYKTANFGWAYLNKYSPRKGTEAAKKYKDTISQAEKRKRWKILDKQLNVKS